MRLKREQVRCAYFHTLLNYTLVLTVQEVTWPRKSNIPATLRAW